MKNVKTQNRFKLCVTVLLAISVVLGTLPMLNLKKVSALDEGENWYIPRVEDTMLNFDGTMWPSNLTATDLQDGGVKWQWTEAVYAMMDGVSKTFPLDGLTMKLNNLTKGNDNGGSLAFSIASKGGWALQSYNQSLALILDTDAGKLKAQFIGANEITLIENGALKYANITGKAFEISIHKATGGYTVAVKIGETTLSGTIPNDSLTGVFAGELFDSENVLVALSPIKDSSTTSVELLAMGPCFELPANSRRIVPQMSNMLLPYEGWTAFTQEDLADGLRLNWSKGAQNMRITTKHSLDLDGLVIEMSDYNVNINAIEGAGVPAFVFGNNDSPEVGNSEYAGLTITFDTEAGGRLIAKSGSETYVIASNIRLHPSRLIGRPVKLNFVAADNGSYNVTIKVGSWESTGTLPKAAIDGAVDLNNTRTVKVSATIVNTDFENLPSVSYVLNGIQNESITWDVDTFMSTQNAWLSSNTNMAETLSSWANSGAFSLVNIPGGGLRYNFNANNPAYREGYKDNIDLSGTLLQFNNLTAAAKLQISFASGSDENVWPPYYDNAGDYSKMLAVRLDTDAGKLSVYPQAGGNELALTNDALKTANIKGKPFFIAFKKQSDGTYTVTVSVDGTDLPALTIPKAVLSELEYPAELTSCKPVLSMFGTETSTFSIDFIGVKKYISDVDVAIDAIGAIGTVSLADGSPIRHARRLYNALAEEKKALVTNYSVLEAAETEYARLTTEADGWLTPMSKANAMLSSSSSDNVQHTLNVDWQSFLKLTDISGGGLRYSFTGAPTNVREGFNRSVNLDGLTLQFDNLYGKGNFALFFGDGDHGGYGPDEPSSKLTLIFNTEDGTITDKDGHAIITDDALKYDNLKEKRFAIGFGMNNDESFELKITVNGQVLSGVLSDDIITLENTANAYVVLTPYGTQTMSFDFLGVGMISQTKKVEDLIDAIGLVKLDSKDAIDAAQAAYDALSPARREQVINYSALVDALEYWYTLDFDTMVNDAIDAIDAIGTVNILSGNAIRKAEEIFERLTDAQKAQVTNAGVFTAALEKYNRILLPYLSLESEIYDPGLTGLLFNGSISEWEGKMSLNRPATGGLQFIWTDAIRNMRDCSAQTYNMDGLRFQISNITKDAGKDGAQLSIQMGVTNNDYDSLETGYCLALVLDTIEGELRGYPGGGLIIKSDALKHSAIENKTILFELNLTNEGLFAVTLKIDGTQLKGTIPTSAIAYASEDALTNTKEVMVALTPWANNGLDTASFSATLLSIQSSGKYVIEDLYEIINAIDTLPDKASKDNVNDILEVNELYSALKRQLKEHITNYSKLGDLMSQVYEMNLVDYSDRMDFVDYSNIVETGDKTQPIWWLLVAALSLITLVLAAKLKSRARQMTGGNSHD